MFFEKGYLGFGVCLKLKARLFGENAFKSIAHFCHDLVVVADMNVVIEADERIRLFADGFYGFLRFDHQRKHFGVAVGVVRLEVAFAYLPCAEKFGSVVIRRAETVDGCGREFLSCGLPDFLESAFEVGLGVVGGPEGDELVVISKQIVPAGSRSVAFVKPFVMEAGHDFRLAEVGVDDTDVVFDAAIPLRPGGVVLERGDVAWQSVAEEAFGGNAVDDIEIVVEVDKVVGEAGDFVDVAFDHHRVVGRQELLRYVVLVADEIDFRVFRIEPVGLLPAFLKCFFRPPGGDFFQPGNQLFRKQ